MSRWINVAGSAVGAAASVLTVAVLVVAMAGCGQPSPAAPDLQSGAPRSASPGASSPLLEPTAFDGGLDRFTIRPPAGWIRDPGQGATDVTFNSATPDIVNGASTIARITVISTNGQGSLEAFVATTKQIVQKEHPGYQFIGEEPIVTESGQRSYLLRSTHSASGLRVRHLALMTVTAERGYVVDAMALESTYSKYEPIVRASLLSLTVR